MGYLVVRLVILVTLVVIAIWARRSRQRLARQGVNPTLVWLLASVTITGSLALIALTVKDLLR
jgi:hypothetical protein